MLRRAVLPYSVRRDGVLFLHVEWDRVGRRVPGLRRGRGGSAGGLCGRGGADGDVYAGRGVADVFDTGCERVCRGSVGGGVGDGDSGDLRDSCSDKRCFWRGNRGHGTGGRHAGGRGGDGRRQHEWGEGEKGE